MNAVRNTGVQNSKGLTSGKLNNLLKGYGQNLNGFKAQLRDLSRTQLNELLPALKADARVSNRADLFKIRLRKTREKITIVEAEIASQDATSRQQFDAAKLAHDSSREALILSRNR